MYKKINSRPANYTVQDLIDKIDKGYGLQEIDEFHNFTDEEILKYNDSIIIAPDYQREYRFTIKDESSLIESLVLGIPIPPVFLANDKYNGVQVMNVVDGQHRLRALYRFVKNKFKIKGISLLGEELEGKYFSDCELKEKQTILSREISAIVFRDFPGREIELEIFNRYNKGTKPLTAQEIRHAVYNSGINSYVSKFATKLRNEKNNPTLTRVYNVTEDRLKKKKLHEEIFVILSILDSGIKPNLIRSLDYAEEYMKRTSDLEKENPIDAEKNFKSIVSTFNKFNEFIEIIGSFVDFPFSREIYGISSRNYKFQISIAMILAGIFRKLFIIDSYEINQLEDNEFINELLFSIKFYLSTSFLEDPNYNGSSTNSKEISQLVNQFEILDMDNI